MQEIEYLFRVYCAVWKLDNNDGDIYIRGTRNALQTLSEREQLALRLRYREGMTYKMIGQKVDGVTAERARYIIQAALRKLRHLPSGMYMRVSQILEGNAGLKGTLARTNAKLDAQRNTVIKQSAVIKEQQAEINELKKQIFLLQNIIKKTQLQADGIIQKDSATSRLKIADIPFLTRTHSALSAMGITDCSELLACASFNELSRIRKIGKASLVDIAQKMYAAGYRDWVNTALRHTHGALRELIEGALE